MPPVSPRNGKLLYHLTSINNLESILRNGLCCRGMLQKGSFKDVADSEILEKRTHFDLEHFVPFHFFAGTPFAGIVQKRDPEQEFVYITIRRCDAEALGCKIVPSHPLHCNHEPLDWVEGINQIAWERLDSRNYSIQEDKNACMAEAIFLNRVLPQKFWKIFVKTSDVSNQVNNMLSSRGLVINVDVNPFMFV